MDVEAAGPVRGRDRHGRGQDPRRGGDRAGAGPRGPPGRRAQAGRHRGDPRGRRLAVRGRRAADRGRRRRASRSSGWRRSCSRSRWPRASPRGGPGRRSSRPTSSAAVGEALDWWAGRAEVMVVEGVGGLLCPLAEGTTVADLAVALDYPLLVVARRGLGTLNHTLLTSRPRRLRALRVAGLVLNSAEPPTGSRGRGDQRRGAGPPPAGRRDPRPNCRTAGPSTLPDPVLRRRLVSSGPGRRDSAPA